MLWHMNTTQLSRNSLWYNADIDAAKRRRRKAERVWRKSKSLADFTEFESSRNRVTYLINKAKKTYYTDLIAD
jgi:Zn-dependent M32 family carboxypeptidase